MNVITELLTGTNAGCFLFSQVVYAMLTGYQYQQVGISTILWIRHYHTYHILKETSLSIRRCLIICTRPTLIPRYLITTNVDKIILNNQKDFVTILQKLCKEANFLWCKLECKNICCVTEFTVQSGLGVPAWMHGEGLLRSRCQNTCTGNCTHFVEQCTFLFYRW